MARHGMAWRGEARQLEAGEGAARQERIGAQRPGWERKGRCGQVIGGT